MKHLRVKSAMRPGAGDCLCRAGADCLESSQKLEGGRAARAAEEGMNPSAEGSGRGCCGCCPRESSQRWSGGPRGPHGADGG